MKRVMLDLTPQFDDILLQLWLPTVDEDGNSSLETKSSPFVVLGGQGDTVRIHPQSIHPYTSAACDSILAIPIHPLFDD